MKISLCKNNKGRKKTKEFLERNLRKVKIDEKDCIHMCSDCKKKVVAIVDGKEIVVKDDYGLLKEIKKILKKSDNLDILVSDLKAEIKDKAEKAKEEKSKDVKSKDDKAKDKVKEKEKDKEKEDKKKSDKDSKTEVKKAEVKAEVVGDELILTLPNETYSLSNLKIKVNFGTFGTSDTTYEVKKAEVKDNIEDEKEKEVAQTLRFSYNPELQIDKPSENIKPEVEETTEKADEKAKDVVQTMRFPSTPELQIDKKKDDSVSEEKTPDSEDK